MNTTRAALLLRIHPHLMTPLLMILGFVPCVSTGRDFPRGVGGVTAITTGLGLLPLLLASGTGSEVQRPLALVVTGGLISSTLLTLLVIPALYKWFQGHTEKV
ncbi:MAG: efflux RND transporter permease subunit [Opitutales bacterium]